MAGNGKRRSIRKADKPTHLLSQAERARKLASECGSQLVAELFEMHAALCERNALLRPPRRPAP